MQGAIQTSWTKIAPFWPLKNLIAVNPLQGFEGLPIEEALIESAAYFQQADLPTPMHDINRESIKWLQAFFDEGQATIHMPMRQYGLYAAWRSVARFDVKLHGKNIIKQAWLAKLPECSEQAIAEMLNYLEISMQDCEQFLILMLTTLPGWASYVKYRTEWLGANSDEINKISQSDYIAVRLAITCLLWPEAKILLEWHQIARKKILREHGLIKDIEILENNYLKLLLQRIVKPSKIAPSRPLAQLVFCIDVRSESFRRALETAGNYETYGVAGFFGVPVKIEDNITGEEYASCPVLLAPQHRVCKTQHFTNAKEYKKNYNSSMFLKSLERFYQSLKYNFTTPFILVEALGFYAGALMALRTFFPRATSVFKTSAVVSPDYSIDDITFADQCIYAESALRLIGLTKNFASIVVLCGHGSSTQNNPHATALDCGACGGRHGSANACILAKILNDKKVREALSHNGLVIPDATNFIGAEHNTTTDVVILYSGEELGAVKQLNKDLQIARELNNKWRCKEMGVAQNIAGIQHISTRSNDWAQVCPEWGLARNAAFIVAPRDVTKNIDLEGRVFLHSYDCTADHDGELLKIILTGPMVVAQWINAQYLFSTLDNVAYGSGSKITQNITGKFGIMQGSASDLMNGLPIQSVYSTDSKSYHELQRLMTVVYAPRHLINKVIAKEEVLIKLFGNGWAKLACIEPETQHYYCLKRDFTWHKIDY